MSENDDLIERLCESAALWRNEVGTRIEAIKRIEELQAEVQRLTAEREAMRRGAERWRTAKASVDNAEELYASLLSGRDPDTDIDALAQAEKGAGNVR